MGTHKIRTTINPREVLTVGDAELLDLKRQGLIVPEAKAEKLDKAAEADEKKEG